MISTCLSHNTWLWVYRATQYKATVATLTYWRELKWNVVKEEIKDKRQCFLENEKWDTTCKGHQHIAHSTLHGTGNTDSFLGSWLLLWSTAGPWSPEEHFFSRDPLNTPEGKWAAYSLCVWVACICFQIATNTIPSPLKSQTMKDFKTTLVCLSILISETG